MPERWKKIDDLVQAALERAPNDRSNFLEQACKGDETLRQEVQSLLGYDERASRFIESPPDTVAARVLTAEQMEPLVGRTLGHYQIVSLLGSGGMGEVYQARDTKLDRTVALKILPSDVAADQQRMLRFVREAKAASSLNHPGVAHIYEIGETEGVSFIAMEYIEGQTLAARIGGGALEITEVIEIAIQATDALDEAHGKGVTHRDLKPANIMITPRSQVKVLDFGLAKINRPREEVNSNVITLAQTTQGIVMGTLPYMSPEQALGRDVDHRSDIFSLGAVIYELATARRPFSGTNAIETVDLILHAQPEAISYFNHNVPVELERIVGKCMEKDREQRYQSAQELLVDLRNLKRGVELGASATVGESQERQRRLLTFRHWLAIAVLVMLVMGALSYQSLFRGAPTAVFPEIKSLAVLPLTNLGNDPAQDYFADGMTEALISNLAQIRALNRVISRTSVMRYKGSPKSLPEIAAELKVDAVIEGTVQRSGGRVLVTAKLIPAATDSPLWTREYNRDLSDVLKLQGEIARAVADEIRIQVTPEERARLAEARNINPQAHEEYLLGRHHLRSNEEDLRQAIEHFDRAIQLAPDYAAAYAGLSRAWRWRGIFGGKNLNEVKPPAREAARHAVELDPRLPEAHIEFCELKTYSFDWSGAEHEIMLALELDGNNAEAHRTYGDLLSELERHDDAIREMQRAEELDPQSSVTQSRYARALYRARRYPEAVPHLKRAIELDPNPGNAMPYWILGELYDLMERYDDALESFEKARSHGARAFGISVGVAAVYARMGKRDEARRLLAELKAKNDAASFTQAAVARVYAALGDKNEAFKVLFRLVDNGDNLAVTIKADPPFESLHSDPRWKELLRRMNFPTPDAPVRGK